MVRHEMIERANFINQVRRLNYRQAYDFFIGMRDRFINADGSFQIEYETFSSVYIENVTPKGKVQDCRKNPLDKEQIKKLIDEGYFIYFDGASCAGKSTMAQKMAKAFEIEVVDIDNMFEEYLNKKLSKCKDEKKRRKILRKADETSNVYIKNHLESEILKKSNNGQKSVILVGGFYELIFRSIIRHTLGGHFKGVVSLIMTENWDTLIKRHDARWKENDDVFKKISYRTLNNSFVMTNELTDKRELCGYGGDYVYIITSKTELF